MTIAMTNLLKALDEVLSQAGTTMHKPAGQKAYRARVIPYELLANLEVARSEYDLSIDREQRKRIKVTKIPT